MKKIKYLVLLMVFSLYLSGYACFPGEEFIFENGGIHTIKETDVYDTYFFAGADRTIERFVLNYEISEGYVYILGLHGHNLEDLPDKKHVTLEELPEKVYFTKYNMEKEDYFQSNRLRDFSEEERDIFLNLFNEETLPERLVNRRTKYQNDTPTDGVWYCEELNMSIDFYQLNQMWNSDCVKDYADDDCTYEIKRCCIDAPNYISIESLKYLWSDWDDLSGEYSYIDGIFKVTTDDNEYEFIETIPEKKPAEGIWYCEDLGMSIDFNKLGKFDYCCIQFEDANLNEYSNCFINHSSTIIIKSESKKTSYLEGSCDYADDKFIITTDDSIYTFVQMEE